MRALLAPLPPKDIQRALVTDINFARQARKAKLARADTLLSGMDAFLLTKLGIDLPPPNAKNSYALPLRYIKASSQIGADYFHPERTSVLQAIISAKHVSRAERLSVIADFIRDVVDVPDPNVYIGLANVQSHTGELLDATEQPGRGLSFQFRNDDVLFARLRPYLNKVWHAEHAGVCSTEFHVIRIKEQESDLLPEYLSAVLRSSVVVAQTKHMMTGNTHPRLANQDVVDLLVPVPSMTIQDELVVELTRRRREARRLREEAAKDWEAAQARFEEILLYPPSPHDRSPES